MGFFDVINNILKIAGDAFAGWITGIFGAGGVSEFVIMLLAALLICGLCAFAFMLLTWTERKIVARIQDRIGPNQAGPYGLLQPIADGIKMFTKEDTTPALADRWVYNLAPLVISVFALLAYAVIPFAPGVVGTNLNIGVFYIIAVGSGSTIAILMAGWGSNNKYSLLGAFRTVAQLIGYEVPMLLNVLPVVMLTGSMSLVDIIEHQTLNSGGTGIPFILVVPLSALVFLISGIAETGRSPFDLLEAESEIVAGFHVEYSGMKFALFFLGEYVNALAVSIMFSVLFLGGYAGPLLPPYIWFLLKVSAVFIGLMWLRGTLPRVRVDQLMSFNWKFLVPMSIINVIIVMVVGKVFVANPAMAHANGGIAVPPLVQALILLASNIVLFVVSLLIVARQARKLRLVEAEDLDKRRAQNIAAVQKVVAQ